MLRVLIRLQWLGEALPRYHPSLPLNGPLTFFSILSQLAQSSLQSLAPPTHDVKLAGTDASQASHMTDSQLAKTRISVLFYWSLRPLLQLSIGPGVPGVVLFD